MLNFRILPDKRRKPDAPPNPFVGSTALRAPCCEGSSLLKIDKELKDGRPKQFRSFNDVYGGSPPASDPRRLWYDDPSSPATSLTFVAVTFHAVASPGGSPISDGGWIWRSAPSAMARAIQHSSRPLRHAGDYWN